MNRAIFQYVLGGLMFSLAGLLFKPLIGVLSPLQIAGWRSVVVALTVLSIRGFAGRSPFSLPISFSRWQCFSAAGLTFQTIFFAIAILLISTADTFLLSNAAPLYTLLWRGLIERRMPNRTELAIVAIAGLGLIIFLADSLTAVRSPLQVWGLVAAIVAGISFAAHIYGQGRVGKEGLKNGEQYTLGTVLLGSALTCVIAFPLSAFPVASQVDSIPFWAIGCVVGLGVFQFAIPMMLWAKSIPRISPLFAAFMPTLIAVWAPLWTYFFRGEAFPGMFTLIGAVLVHLAVILTALWKDKQTGEIGTK